MRRRHLGAEDRVDQGRVRADDAARPDARAPAQRGARLDHGVRLDLDVGVDPGRLGVGDRDAGEHVALEDSPAGLGADHGELGAGVDADVDAHVVDLVGEHAPALLAQRPQHVAEVVLAGGVVVRDPRQRLGERARRRTRRCSCSPRGSRAPRAGRPRGAWSRRSARTRRSGRGRCGRATRGRRARRVTTVAAAPASRWESTSSAISSGGTSGWSPFRTTTVSASRTTSSAARTAPPVPSGSGWTTVSVPSGRAPERSRSGETITQTRPAPASLRGEHRPGDHRPAADRVQDLGQRRAHPRALAGGHDQDGGPAHLRNRRAARATRRAPRRRMVTSTPYGGVNVTLVSPVVLRLVAPTLAAAIRGGVVAARQVLVLKATWVRFPPPELWR